MKIIDISRPLNAKTPTWPGDTPFTYKLNWSKEETGSVNVGSVEMSVHTATHVDSPFHFDTDGTKMGEVPLHSFIGAAVVIDVSGQPEITKDGLMKLEGKVEGKRILFKTNSWKDEHVFPTEIPTLTGEAVALLIEWKVPLIGLDLPSVDHIDSKELPIHHLLAKGNIAILEGLDLREVAEGEYELIALPLKIEESDGSPVRAILRTLD